MTKKEQDLLIERINKKSNLRKLSDEDLYNLIDLYYVHTEEPDSVNTFPLEPYYMGLKFYKEMYPDFYKQIVDASEKGRIVIREGLPKSTTNRVTKQVQVNLRNANRDAFCLVHEFAHYIDFINENKFTPKNRVNLFTEAFAFYMERQFEKYLIEKDYFSPALDNKLRRKSCLSWYANTLSDYLWLSNIYSVTKKIPSYEEERAKNILLVDSSDPKLYLTKYLIGDVISFSLRDKSVNDFKDSLCSLSLSSEIKNRLKNNKITLTF